ncbi:hypothetical protein [Psychromonas sp.]|uniref:hypothetical protein n=1 Tax=Psychromonas sp. TaxID=1884585 RepID=UPI00356247A6
MTVYVFSSKNEKMIYTSLNTGYANMTKEDARNDLASFKRSHGLYTELQIIAKSPDFYFNSFKGVDDVESYKCLLGEFAYDGCRLVGKPSY